MAVPIELSKSGDDRFGGIAWNAMIHMCAMEEPADLTAMQLPMYHVFWYMSEVVANGHFHYFINYTGDSFSPVIDALRDIEAVQSLAILTAAIELFTTRHEERVTPESIQQYELALEQLNSRFCSAGEDEVLGCMQAYLEQHEHEFIVWRD